MDDKEVCGEPRGLWGEQRCPLWELIGVSALSLLCVFFLKGPREPFLLRFNQEKNKIAKKDFYRSCKNVKC